MSKKTDVYSSFVYSDTETGGSFTSTPPTVVRGNSLPSIGVFAALLAVTFTSGTPYIAHSSVVTEPSGVSVTSQDAMKSLENNGLKTKFTALAAQWREETIMHSSVSKIVMHPAYQKIMAMGEKALPFILSDLQQKPGHWFYALRLITDESPVKPEDAGDMKRMSDAWVQWGIEKGFIA